jgi:hypothetical protein
MIALSPEQFEAGSHNLGMVLKAAVGRYFF